MRSYQFLKNYRKDHYQIRFEVSEILYCRGEYIFMNFMFTKMMFNATYCCKEWLCETINHFEKPKMHFVNENLSRKFSISKY